MHVKCLTLQHLAGFPWLSGKESVCQCRRHEFDSWVRKSPWRRKWQPTPVILPGRARGQRSLAGYSPRGRKRTGHNLEINSSNSASSWPDISTASLALTQEFIACTSLTRKQVQRGRVLG